MCVCACDSFKKETIEFKSPFIFKKYLPKKYIKKKRERKKERHRLIKMQD